MNEIATTSQLDSSIMLRVAGGDLSALTPDQQLKYYLHVCDSIGVNPYTQPFNFLKLNNKLVLYPNRTCTDQLRETRKVSLSVVSREIKGDVYIVTVRATDGTGRHDEATGCVAVKGLAGDALANAYMKAETKAKRRATLSLCGLGWIDESEVETVPGAVKVEGPQPEPEPIATIVDEKGSPEKEKEAVANGYATKPESADPELEKAWLDVYTASDNIGWNRTYLAGHIRTWVKERNYNVTMANMTIEQVRELEKHLQGKVDEKAAEKEV